MKLVDVVIIGGGPAGLNAAVVLGRCRRSVLLFDDGHPRNRRSQRMHNYLTRDDIQPSDFLFLARKEVRKYGVRILEKRIQSIRRMNGYFQAKDEEGIVHTGKKVLIATGLADKLPPVKGLEEIYGQSVFHCPYCDAWEVRDKKIAVYARNKNGFELASLLLCWSQHVSIFTDGRNYFSQDKRDTLKELGITLISSRISQLNAINGKLKSIAMRSGEKYACDALFFVNGYEQQCDLVKNLGCVTSNREVVVTNRKQQTNIPGVYVAGDASRDMHFVVVACAEGAKAAVTINKELIKENLEKKGAKKALRHQKVSNRFVAERSA